MRRAASLLAVLAAAVLGGQAGAAEYGAPPPDAPLYAAPPAPPLIRFPWTPTVWYGPSPFAVTGSAYGLSGYGYFYDQPTERRFGSSTYPRRERYRRSVDLRRRTR